VGAGNLGPDSGSTLRQSAATEDATAFPVIAEVVECLFRLPQVPRAEIDMGKLGGDRGLLILSCALQIITQ